MAPADDGVQALPDASPLTVEDADGRANEIGGRSGRESRLDLLLAEELAVDRDFACWFLQEAGQWRHRAALPDGPPLQADVRLNLMEDMPPIPPAAYGETDIDLTLTWQDGNSVSVVLEDKVWSPFQPRQPERCVMRAENRENEGVAVLVAPDSYIKSHMSKAKIFHGYISVEQIIERLASSDSDEASDPTGQRRRAWRARLLTELITRPPPPIAADDTPTVEFTRFCVEWFQRNATYVVPNTRSQHTAGQGWLWFETPRGLGYKASGWTKKPRAGVDLYVADHGFHGTAQELDEILQELGAPEGFTRTVDTAKPPNLVLRCECAKVSPHEGPPLEGSDGERDIIEALEACRRVADWLQANQERLSSSPRAEREP
jgi:hypothetical protein